MLQSHQQDGDGSGQAPGRTRQGGKGGSAAAARSSVQSLVPRRAASVPPGRTHCTRDGTGSGPAVPDSHNDGTRRLPPSTFGRPGSSPPPGGAGGGQSRLEIGFEHRIRRGRRGRKGAYHQGRSGRQVREKGADQVPQAPANRVADHRVAHRFRHDEAGARRGGKRRLLEEKMNDHCAATRPAPATNRCGEVGATPQSLRRGQHVYLGIPDPDQRRLRPTACRDPWSGGRTGWPDRPGCACAAGNRGSSRAGGCSAGRCACSRVNSVFVRHLWGHRAARRPL
jgi:hypothetical protein